MSWKENHRTALITLVTVIAAMGVVLLLVWSSEPLKGPRSSEGTQDAKGQEPAEGAQVELAAQPDLKRELATKQPPPQKFTSKFRNNDVPELNPIRDGINVIVRHESGSPCADMPITVTWHKGFDLYGEDRGLTTHTGRFATTVKTIDQFEAIALAHPEHGKLVNRHDLLLSSSEPDAVLMIVPDLVAVRILVLDLDDDPVAGATVELSSTSNLPPREFRLSAQTTAAVTDETGHATVKVQPGQCTGEAKRTGFSQLQARSVPITQNGGEVTLRMVDHDKRQEVTIIATAPAGIEISGVGAISQPLSGELANRLSVEIDSGRRQFEVKRRGDSFTARIDPLPWRVYAGAKGCTQGFKDLPGFQTTVHLTLHYKPPSIPKARLEVTVTHPDGTPAPGAKVHLHEKPDIIYGSKHSTDEGGRFVYEGKPGLRVGASATKRGYSRGIGGPVQLLQGETIKIALQLREALSLRGRIVDRSGKPVQALVKLHRPAEALRALGENVPVTLVAAPTDDRQGTLQDGKFSYDDLYPGPHAVWAYPKGGGWPGRVTASPGEDVTVVVGEGLEGFALVTMIAREAETGAVIPRIQLVPAKYEIFGGVGHYALIPQELELLAFAKGRVVTGWGPQFVGAGPHTIEFEMLRSDPVFVRVVDSGGQPIAGADIRALDRDGEALSLTNIRGQAEGSRVRSNRAGRAQMLGLPPGELRLRVNRDEAAQEYTLPASSGRSSAFELRWR